MGHERPLQSWRRGDRLQSQSAKHSRQEVLMPTVVLTEDEVLAIYEMAHQGHWTQQEIADQYGITRAAVGHIKAKRNWGHLTSKLKGNDNGSRE
jgi:hypothetical protein